MDVPIVASHVPAYAHPGDAGADLVSTASVRLEAGERALVPTGVRIALPEGYAAFVVPRSGLAVRHGITIVNSPGTIDAGYRGEIKVALLNTDRAEAYEIAAGDRIAQLIVSPVARARSSKIRSPVARPRSVSSSSVERRLAGSTARRTSLRLRRRDDELKRRRNQRRDR